MPSTVAKPEVTDTAFAAAQDLFSEWTEIIYRLVADRLNAHPEQLTRLQIRTDADTHQFPTDNAMRGEDPAEWVAAVYIEPPLPIRSAMTPEQLDAWRQPVDAWIIETLIPLENLLDALGMNIYIFEGLETTSEGLQFSIEPYEDAAIVQNIHRVMGLPVLYSMQLTTAGKLQSKATTG